MRGRRSGKDEGKEEWEGGGGRSRGRRRRRRRRRRTMGFKFQVCPRRRGFKFTYP
jgi:hypothetical protein